MPRLQRGCTHWKAAIRTFSQRGECPRTEVHIVQPLVYPSPGSQQSHTSFWYGSHVAGPSVASLGRGEECSPISRTATLKGKEQDCLCVYECGWRSPVVREMALLYYSSSRSKMAVATMAAAAGLEDQKTTFISSFYGIVPWWKATNKLILNSAFWCSTPALGSITLMCKTKAWSPLDIAFCS